MGAFFGGGELEGLFDLVMAISHGDLHPLHYLQLLRVRYEALEPTVLSLVPERGDLFQRITSEMEKLSDLRLLLRCIPVGLKDTFHAHGFATRAGSALPPHVLTGEEGPLVRKLKGLGAIIIGKTHTTEFSYLAPAPTRNPHDPRRTAGGSSSGSAAAVAYGLCPLAVGSQTMGSTIKSAAFCGVVGFKPSFGRAPTEGSIPLSPSLDHIGFFTRDVEGMELAAQLLIEDWINVEEKGDLTLGIPEGPYLHWAGHEARECLKTALRLLKEEGVRILQVRILENFQEMMHRHRRLMAAEAAQVHGKWFSEFRALYRPQTVSLIERGMSVPDSELEMYREGRIRLRETLAERMEIEGISAWICPSAVGPAPVGFSTTGESVMSIPWTYAGLPAISLPFGRSSDGLPMGLQLVGKWMGDEELLGSAKAIWSILTPRSRLS